MAKIKITKSAVDAVPPKRGYSGVLLLMQNYPCGPLSHVDCSVWSSRITTLGWP